MNISLLAICAGTVKPLFVRDTHDEKQLRREMSAVQKSPVSTMADPRNVHCGRLGIAGDEQADPSVHGGLFKAVYCYPNEHYAFWRNELPWLADQPQLFGQVGENLCLAGLVESVLWIGDALHIGPQVILRVTKPREPCFKFNARMRSAHASKRMIQTQRCGWYCSVQQEGGDIQAGHTITVVPGPRDTTVQQECQRLTRPNA